MSQNVFIIVPSEIKDNSRVEINVDDRSLRDLILTTQDIRLSEILGETLYKRVIDSIYNYNVSNTSIPNDIIDLLPYIKNYLKYKVISEFIVLNHYKLTNKGTVKLSDNNATSATNGDIEWYKTYYDNASLSYKSLLIEYLKNNRLVVDKGVDTDKTFRGVYMNYGSNFKVNKILQDSEYNECYTPSQNVSVGTQGPQGFQGPQSIGAGDNIYNKSGTISSDRNVLLGTYSLTIGKDNNFYKTFHKYGETEDKFKSGSDEFSLWQGPYGAVYEISNNGHISDIHLEPDNINFQSSTKDYGTFSSLVVSSDSVGLFPSSNGSLIITSIKGLTAQDNLLGRISNNGNVGTISIGTGLTLSNGVLSATSQGIGTGDNIYNSDGTFSSNRILDIADKTLTIKSNGATSGTITYDPTNSSNVKYVFGNSTDTFWSGKTFITYDSFNNLGLSIAPNDLRFASMTSFSSGLNISTEGSARRSLLINKFGNDSGGVGIIHIKDRTSSGGYLRATNNINTVSEDIISKTSYQVRQYTSATSSSGNLYIGASEEVIAENVTSSNVDARISFHTSYNGTIEERLRISSNGNIIIGGTSSTSAKLKVDSTTSGFLPPRMTGIQAESIVSPEEGLLIYSTDGSGSTITTKGWWGYNGTTWEKL